MPTAPLLSIGMIFKNEERCIERCLKSLEPLRKVIPCELVMADTGATDGSHAVAERYADQLFDFEWIDDFAAARNAVMERCRGKWYLSIDCDEWLDTDVSELLAFLQKDEKTNNAFLIVRDYLSKELEQGDNYSDFPVLRLMRMSTGQRYHGAIHESWYRQEPTAQLAHTILHHDGYYFEQPEIGQRKRKRNVQLLLRELEKEPENLALLLQYIESGTDEADYMQYVRRAVSLVQSTHVQYGGCIMRYAVDIAREKRLTEFEEWIHYTEEQLSDSIFTRTDVQYSGFRAAFDTKNWDKAVQYGEAYQRGLRVLRGSGLSKKQEAELRLSVVHSRDPLSENILLTCLADAYAQNQQGEKALQTLAALEGEKLLPGQIRNAVVAFGHIHSLTMQDASLILPSFYENISSGTAGSAKRAARMETFDLIAASMFTAEFQKKEREQSGFSRPAYTVFNCLAKQCEAGRGAAVMMTSDPAAMQCWLAKVENWQALPIEALEHALQAGVAFPMEAMPLNVEVLDGLAARMTHGDNMARQMVLACSDNQEYPTLQSLFWAQSLVRAALRSFDWSLGKNDAPVSKFFCPEKKKADAESETPDDTPETGLALIRHFVQIESTMLPLLYTPQLLAEENAALLLPMHRWGLYCSLAFEALDNGTPQEYLALLRRGLKACPGEKDMVQFLLDRFREDTRPKANPELLALAERVRTILAAYNPDDPAVAALKASAAYKQVAWLIEEPNTRGLPS